MDHWAFRVFCKPRVSYNGQPLQEDDDEADEDEEAAVITSGVSHQLCHSDLAAQEEPKKTGEKAKEVPCCEAMSRTNRRAMSSGCEPLSSTIQFFLVLTQLAR